MFCAVRAWSKWRFVCFAADAKSTTLCEAQEPVGVRLLLPGIVRLAGLTSDLNGTITKYHNI